MSAEALSEAWGAYPGNPGRTIVLLAVGDIVNDTYGHELWASSNRLADKTGLSPGNVRNHLAALVADGWLEVLTKGGGQSKPTRYRWLGHPTQNRADARGNGSDTARTRAPYRADARGHREHKDNSKDYPTPRGSNHQSRNGDNGTDLQVSEALDAYAARAVPPPDVRSVDAWRRTVRDNADAHAARARDLLDRYELTPGEVGQVLASDRAGEISPVLQRAALRVPFDPMTLVEGEAS